MDSGLNSTVFASNDVNVSVNVGYNTWREEKKNENNIVQIEVLTKACNFAIQV